MTLVNLTPHAINIITDGGTVTVAPSGQVARVQVSQTVVGNITFNDMQVPIMDTVFGDVEDLPPPQDGVMYLVSRVVLSASPGRNDLVVPHDLVRDDEGRIIGAKALARS